MTSMQTFFIALADKTRRRILNLIGEHEISVGYLTEILEVSQPKISRHLAYLRNAGIVSARRDGKWIYYQIETPEDPYAARVLSDTLEWLESQKTMRKDREKASSLDGSPAETGDGFIILPRADVFVEREEMEIHLL